jgi:hypothetical protein
LSYHFLVSFQKTYEIALLNQGRRSHLKELELKEAEFDIQTVSELIDDSDEYDNDDDIDYDERLKRRAFKRKGKRSDNSACSI